MLRKLIKDRKGSVATISAIMSVPLLFVVGVAVDYAIMENLESALQNSADASALSSAKELALSSSKDSTVKEIAKQYVMASLSNGINLDKYQESLSVETGISSDRKSVTVDLSLKWQPLVLKYIKPDAFPLQVKSKATLAGNENICIIALGSSSKISMAMRGVSSVKASGCAIYSNSNGKSGISIVESSMLQASNTYTVGGYKGPEKNYKPRPIINAPVIIDPLKNRIAPKSSNCTKTGLRIFKGTTVLYPGTYCGGITIGDRAAVKFRPGVYILRNGPLRVSGNAFMKGQYVGFVFEGDESTFDFGNSTTISLTAPKSGALAGILFFENRNSTKLRKFSIRSRNAEKFEGTVYLPNGQLIVSKKSRVGQRSKWTAIIANRIDIMDGPRLQINSNYAASNIPVPEGVGPQGTVTRLTK